MKFNEVFSELLIINETSVQEVSENTGIDDSILYDYIHGRIPNIKYAVVIANYFNCSLNYLMGIDDCPNLFKFKQSYDISVFSNRYDKLLDENKITHYKLYREKKLNYSSHNAWRKGAVPSMLSLAIIAEYFGVSIDYLVGRCD